MRHDFTSLILFRAVARAGSIAGAAAKHNMAASAVSKRISDLEARLGAPLLYRERRGVDVTAAGRELLTHIDSLVGVVEHMDAEMSRYADGKLGTIRIAANTSSITQFLPEDLAEFVKHHPELRIELAERTSREILKAVHEGQCDIGIFSGLTSTKRLKTLPYRRDTLVVAMPPEHRLARQAAVPFEALLDEDFVGLQGGSSIQSHVRKVAAAAGRELRIRVEVQSFDGVRRMVQARLGIAILPYGAVEPYVHDAELTMVALDEPWAKRDLFIAVRRLGTLPRHARLLLDSLTGS